MKIIIIPSVPAMTGRRYCFAKELAAMGHEVHYIQQELPYKVSQAELFQHMRSSLSRRTFTYETFTMHKVARLPFFWPIINGVLFRHQIKKLFRRLDADYIITQGFTNEVELPAYLPFIYDLADDYAAPADVYGSLIYKLAFKVLDIRGVMRRQCKNAVAVACVSEILVDFAKQYNSQVLKLPNGVEAAYVKDIMHTKPIRKKHSIVYASGFGGWSRLVDAAKAVHSLRREFPDISLTLIGDGVEVPELQQFIDESRAADYIRFLGKMQDRRKLYGIIAEHEIGLSISDKNKWRDASHPMKVMDYSAFGLKVVSTNLAEIEALKFPNVHIFNDQKQSLEDVIREALLDVKKYDAVSKTVTTVYSWDTIVKRLITLAATVRNA